MRMTLWNVPRAKCIDVLQQCLVGTTTFCSTGGCQAGTLRRCTMCWDTCCTKHPGSCWFCTIPFVRVAKSSVIRNLKEISEIYCTVSGGLRGLCPLFSTCRHSCLFFLFNSGPCPVSSSTWFISVKKPIFLGKSLMGGKWQQDHSVSVKQRTFSGYWGSGTRPTQGSQGGACYHLLNICHPSLKICIYNTYIYIYIIQYNGFCRIQKAMLFQLSELAASSLWPYGWLWTWLIKMEWTFSFFLFIFWFFLTLVSAINTCMERRVYK